MAERPRLENFFDATHAVAEIAAGLHGRWSVNVFTVHACMQSPHKTDMGLQAFHVKRLRPEIFFGVPDVVAEMAAALLVLLVDHKKTRGNYYQCCRHGHMLQDCDALQSTEELLQHPHGP